MATIQRFSTSARRLSRPVIASWYNVTGWSVDERLALEQKVWQSENPSHDVSFIVGYEHRGRFQRSDTSIVPLETSTLWTTIIAHDVSGTDTDFHLDMYDRLLQELESQQQKSEAPRKTLIMESKACCGIGTTGKILSLSEIQSKQLAQKQKGRRLSVDDKNNTVQWDGRAVAVSFDKLMNVENDSFMHRGLWHWDLPKDAQEDDPRIFLSDLFGNLRPKHAVDTLYGLCDENFEVDDTTV